MVADISITGLSASDPVPGVYMEVNFAAGPASGSGAVYEAVILANKTAAGSGVVNTQIYGPDSPVQLQTDEQAKAIMGSGSEAHLMWREFAKLGLTARVLLVTESAGANATGTITLTTNATGSGTLRLYICDAVLEVGIVSGDSVTTIAAAMVSAINAKDDLPVTATNALGVITVTAKNKGPRSNSLRFMPLIVGSSVGTTVSPTVDTAMSGGTTADDVTTAISTLSAGRYYYIVHAHNDATNIGLIKAHVNSSALPIVGKRQRHVTALCGDLSSSNAVSTAVNAERAEIPWSEQCPYGSTRLAAHLGATYLLGEQPENFRTNFASYGNDSATAKTWNVPSARSTSAWPSRASISSALLAGLSPVGVNANGSTYLVNRVTTRTLSGANADYRISRAHKVTIMDRIADELVSMAVLQYSGKRLANDPKKGERFPTDPVVTPQLYRGSVTLILEKYARDLGLIERLDETLSAMVVARQQSNRARLGVSAPIYTVDNFEQSAMAINQVQ